MAEDSVSVEPELAAVGLCFRRGGKVYYFLPGDFPVELENFVVVETDKGVDIGEVVELIPRLRPCDEKPTKRLVRPATSADVRRKRQLFQKEERALEICAKKLAESGLPMKLIEASYTLDGKRLTFTFVAENRVDFRDLVRDLAQTFRCRIELRQVGVRDQAKAIGGLGPCGRPLCCATFLRDFMSVGIRLAKDQGLSMNPAKLSGACDRLMCCLRYEHAQYVEMNKRLPKAGTRLETSRGTGEVVERNLLVGAVRLRDEQGGEFVLTWEELEAQGLLRPPGAAPERFSRPARPKPAPPPEKTAVPAEGAAEEAATTGEGTETATEEAETGSAPKPPRRGRRRGRRGGRRRGGPTPSGAAPEGASGPSGGGAPANAS